MQMTYDDYINNPMGVKNSVISNREVFRTLYMQKLDKILVREVGKVKYVLYKTANKYFIHMKIPSEVIDKFYYDTVIEFYTDRKELLGLKSLSSYYVKFYSNDPSFVFTFAHAMIKNNLFIEDLSSKMSKDAIKKVAEMKNPKDEVGYVKSLYFAYLLIKSYGLFDKAKYDVYAQPYDKNRLLEQIVHADKKISDRQEAGIELEKEKRKNAIKSGNSSRTNVSTTNNMKSSKMSNNISMTKTMQNTKKVNSIKTTKRTKRI